MRFRDRVVLIAGGTGALGGAVVHAFLDEGARPFVISRSGPGGGGFASHAERVTHLPLDLADADAESALHAAVRALDRIDAVVNTVGGWSGGTRLTEEDAGTLGRMIALNLMPGYRLARAIVPRMGRSGSGVFIEVASRAAAGPQPGQASYAASKAAAVSLFQSLAEEVKESGVRIYVVSPTTMDTEANRRAMPKADRSTWVGTDEVARVILDLCSDEARAASGTVVPVPSRG